MASYIHNNIVQKEKMKCSSWGMLTGHTHSHHCKQCIGRSLLRDVPENKRPSESFCKSWHYDHFIWCTQNTTPKFKLVCCQIWALIYEYSIAVSSCQQLPGTAFLLQGSDPIIQPVHIVHHLIPFTWYSKPSVTLMCLRAGSVRNQNCHLAWMHSHLLKRCYFVVWAKCGAGNQLSLNLHRHPVTKQMLPGTVNPLWHWLAGSHYLRRRITRPLDVGGFSSWWGSRTGRLSDLKEPGISSCPDLQLLPLGLSLLSPIQTEIITDNRTLSWPKWTTLLQQCLKLTSMTALTEEDIYYQATWRNGKKRVAFWCDNICLVNQKYFREDSQYLYLQHSGFSHRRNQCQDKHYPCLTLWHLLVIKIRVINTRYSTDDGY